MRVVVISKDWKEDWLVMDMVKAMKEVVGDRSLETTVYAQDINQGEVDATVMVFTDTRFTQEQLESLWAIGDLYLCDETWEAETFEQLLDKIQDHVKREVGI